MVFERPQTCFIQAVLRFVLLYCSLALAHEPMMEHSMPDHKFHIGQIVQPRPQSRSMPAGSYKVIRRMPERAGEFEYRIKSMKELHERVVLESELIAV
jgi:hypothetical protein